MTRRTLWQEIRDWLRPSARDLEASSADMPASIPPAGPGGQGLPSVPVPQGEHLASVSSAALTAEAPSRPDNVVPFVRPEHARLGHARAGRVTFDGAAPPDDVAGVSAPGAGGTAVLDEGFPDSDLLDFMAADVDPVPADPAFRDRLREQLWEMVVEEGVAAPAPAGATRAVDADEHGPESV